MEIINLEKDIFIYRFKMELLSLNVFVIQHEDTCTIIDTAYSAQFTQVLEDLEKKGIKVVRVIGTHSHPDHIAGLHLLKDIEIVGSIYSEEIIKYFTNEPDLYIPNVLVDDELIINFGRHVFYLESCRGHSKSGLIVTLNDKYIFVGDELIFDNNGDSILPLCFERGPEVHIESISKIIASIGDKTIVPGHGLPLNNKDVINLNLQNRLSYLQYLSDNKDATYDDFVKATNITFIWNEWHLYNQKGDMKWWMENVWNK